MNTDVMGLEIKQKHQFYSEKFEVTLDVFEMLNNDIYLNCQQLNNLFDNTFDQWIQSNEDHLEFKAIQYYTNHGYEKHEDYLNNIVQIINDVKYYSVHCVFTYVSENNMDLSEEFYTFYRSL